MKTPLYKKQTIENHLFDSDQCDAGIVWHAKQKKNQIGGGKLADRKSMWRVLLWVCGTNGARSLARFFS